MNRRKLSLILMTTLTATMMPLASLAAPSPDRPTYHCTKQKCDTVNRVVFNSIVDNPNVGDERLFFDGQVSNGGSSSDKFQNKLQLHDGQQILLSMFVHNDATKQTAKTVIVRMTLPTGAIKSYTSTASISAINAAPQTVRDTFDFTANNGKQYKLTLKSGSAQWKSAGGDKRTLGDSLINKGASLGDLKAGFNDQGYVTAVVTVKEVKPDTATMSTTSTGSTTAGGTSGTHTQTAGQGSGSTANTPVAATAPAATTAVTPPTQAAATPSPQPAAQPAAPPQQTLPATGAPVAAGALGTTAIGYALTAYRRSRTRLLQAIRSDASNR